MLGILLVGIVVSHVGILWFLVFLRESFGIDMKGRKYDPLYYRPPTVNGAIESILYPAALLVGHPEFVSFWVVLKVASLWNRWGKDDEGRALFQIYLAGNALSIITSYVTYRLIRGCCIVVS